MERCHILLADTDLNDLEEDYWSCSTLPTITVTRTVALGQLRATVEWWQRHAAIEENHDKVTFMLDKADWQNLCSLAGLHNRQVY